MIYHVLALIIVGLEAGLFTPMLRRRRLDRRYEEADIRLVGGPFHGQRVNRRHAANVWPPPPTITCYRYAEPDPGAGGDKTQLLMSTYELRTDDRTAARKRMEYSFATERIAEGLPRTPMVPRLSHRTRNSTRPPKAVGPPGDKPAT